MYKREREPLELCGDAASAIEVHLSVLESFVTAQDLFEIFKAASGTLSTL